MSDFKAKITFNKLDLSSFAVSCLLQGLSLKSVPFSLNKKATAVKSSVMDLELTLTKGNEHTPVYGEVPIADFLVSQANQAAGKSVYLGFGDNLSHDHFMNKLNSDLRPLAA